jgi:hypothetical protein
MGSARSRGAVKQLKQRDARCRDQPNTISQEFLVNRIKLSIIAASLVVAGTLGAQQPAAKKAAAPAAAPAAAAADTTHKKPAKKKAAAKHDSTAKHDTTKAAKKPAKPAK